MPKARLTDRATLKLTGPDAVSFLQNIVTADLDQLVDGEVRPAALLTPQGKILFDFLVSRTEGGLRLDIARGAGEALMKRLTLYRLRAKVELSMADEAVAAAWDEPDGTGLVDRRFPAGAFRLYGEDANGLPADDADDFAAYRIGNGVAEAETDFPGSDVFPHDVLLDQNEGVSFKKGCFVGQEVVSRMQHRGTARKRIVVLRGERHLTPGANVLAGERQIGVALSAAGTVAMALVRIDRLADALRADEILSLDGVPVEAEIPAWAGYTLPENGAPEEA